MFQINVVEKIKTYILQSVTFSPQKDVVYEIMSKYVAKPEWPQMTIWQAVHTDK